MTCFLSNVCFADWTDYWEDQGGRMLAPKAVLKNAPNQVQLDEAVGQLADHIDYSGEVYSINLGHGFAA